jgi:hypothetical protein
MSIPGFTAEMALSRREPNLLKNYGQNFSAATFTVSSDNVVPAFWGCVADWWTYCRNKGGGVLHCIGLVLIECG